MESEGKRKMKTAVERRGKAIRKEREGKEIKRRRKTAEDSGKRVKARGKKSGKTERGYETE